MTCSADEYEREDVCCKKCPKGTRVSSNCSKASQTKCDPCPSGLYMDSDNYVEKCLYCKSCSSNDHLQTLNTCTTERDTKCKCMEGYYCTNTNKRLPDDCESCSPVRRCPPGLGVSVPPNSTHDTVCTPCPPGTFNNKTDYLTTCQNHTRCLDMGRNLISAGTSETDAKCGALLSGCHWMIPAGLWVGLILTLILVLIGVIRLRSKRRRKTVITLQNSEPFFPPALPPDVIKYPGNTDLQILTNNGQLCAEENDGALECEVVCDGQLCAEENDGALECEGVSASEFSESCAAFSFPNTCMTLIIEPYRSEPQEDDWPGL